VGLVFIVMFGLVLTELTGTDSKEPVQTAGDGEDLRLAWTPPTTEVSPAVSLPGESNGPVISPPPTQVAVPPVSLTASYDPLPIAIQAAPPVEATDSDADDSVEIVSDEFAQPATLAQSSPPAQREIPGSTGYTVQPGDSLIRIATKTYGPQHSNKYVLIKKANGNSEIIRPGQVLIIPPLSTERAYREMTIDQLRDNWKAKPADKPAADKPLPDQTYTVRCGDTLSKIARKTLNDDSRSAVMRIFNANRDKLRNPNSVPVGVSLLIPQ